jgi:hypothetical protein
VADEHDPEPTPQEAQRDVAGHEATCRSLPTCAVVIAWGYHCCTDGSGTNADTYAAADIGSAISAAPINAAYMNAARADTAHATSAAIR